MDQNEIITQLRQSLDWQIVSIELLREALTDNLEDAVRAIAGAEKVIVSGLGKSGFIARKMAATLTSIRIPGIYVHPVDALHGDIGLLAPSDVMVLFSKSGETPEVLRLAEIAKESGTPCIAITSRDSSSLATTASHAVSAPILRELDPNNLLPTASTTGALVVADLLCVGASLIHGDVVGRLRQSHPKGAIGAALLRTVADVMHVDNALPIVQPDTALQDALALLSEKALGIVCIVSSGGELLGIITDGDVRRAVSAGIKISSVRCSDVMTLNPVTVLPSHTLYDALQLMENRERQISVVPVVNTRGACVGVVRVHDIVRAQW